MVIYNFEDTEVLNIPGKKLIILRDPFNWIASRLQVGLQQHRTHMWKNHVRSNEQKIIFNKWFLDRAYRKEVCDMLNLNFTDDGLDEVFWHGSSSFDGSTFDGKAQEMKVLERYKKWENDKKYLSLIDEEMKQLWSYG